ncbi:MAG TPA: glycosyltransferase family 2 protein [Dehalococcoidia bacterium]|nr:glycosyltransferase family 2 protein [Dehalococcoidia bacterium]
MQESRPFVSVIVPIRNEERHIERCLAALGEQDYPRDRFEVIVVDGESTDRTRPLVERFMAESTLDVTLLSNPAKRTAPGLNIGLQRARGDVIIRVDGHCIVAPDFITESVAALEWSGADCVGGPITSVGEGFWGRAIAVAMSSRFGVGGAAFRVSAREQWTDTVAFGAYRRSLFDSLGGFREDLDGGEDDEFNYRLLSAGGRILLTPSIRSTYIVRSSLPAVLRQYFRYGRAKAAVLAAHPEQTRPRQLAPPAFVAALGATGALALAGARRPLGALLCAYGAANAVATALEGRRCGLPSAVGLPLVFAALHLGYGAGVFAGLAGLLRTRTARRERQEAPL